MRLLNHLRIRVMLFDEMQPITRNHKIKMADMLTRHFNIQTLGFYCFKSK